MVGMIGIKIILILLITQTDTEFNWDTAERYAKEQKANSEAIKNMRTDTTVTNLIKSCPEINKKNTGIYEIIVNDKNVDSLQNIIDSISKLFMKELIEYDLHNKIKYCNYMLTWNKKDTAQIINECELYRKYLMLECDKLTYILNEQKGNSRYTINLYIKRNKEHLGNIGSYIYQLTRKYK